MILTGFAMLFTGLWMLTQNTQTRVGAALVPIAIAIIVVATLR